jgi:hypothetical protein
MTASASNEAPLAIKKGFNKFTVQKQMYLIHTGQ